jgi:hypothetical protein
MMTMPKGYSKEPSRKTLVIVNVFGGLTAFIVFTSLLHDNPIVMEIMKVISEVSR